MHSGDRLRHADDAGLVEFGGHAERGDHCCRMRTSRRQISQCRRERPRICTMITQIQPRWRAFGDRLALGPEPCRLRCLVVFIITTLRELGSGHRPDSYTVARERCDCAHEVAAVDMLDEFDDVAAAVPTTVKD